MRALIVALVLAGAAPAHAQWAATAYIDNNAVGDVQSGRGGVGVSAAHYFHGFHGFHGLHGSALHLGLELDAELHGHFFRDEDVAYLQPDGVDLNTSAALGSANVVVPYCVRGAAGTWCPYALAGLGVIRATLKGHSHMPGIDSFDRAQTDLALSAGVGVMHALTRWIGFRVDARYLRAFVDESSTTTYAKDYGYWRISVGVTFGGPTP